MPFDYATIRDDLFDSGGRPVPIDNKIPRKLRDWALAEGVAIGVEDTDQTVLRKIAEARNVAFSGGDTDLVVLGKIAVEPVSFGVWPYLQEIMEDGPADGGGGGPEEPTFSGRVDSNLITVDPNTVTVDFTGTI